MKTKLSNQKGFTIIEVLIVLAIAGLIMLVVFLAVPALQRNQRNTARKNDVGRLGGAAAEFVSNNNGTLPAVSTATVACPGANDAGRIVCAAGTLSQYVATNVSVEAGAAANAAVADLVTVRIITGAKCAAGGTATNAGASVRQMSILYAAEGSGASVTGLCQDV